MLIVNSVLLIRRFVPWPACTVTRVHAAGLGKAEFLQFRHVWGRDELGKPGLAALRTSNGIATCANR